MKIVGIKFNKHNNFGDFNFLFHKEYENSLFIFNDIEEYQDTCKYGVGNACMRKYNKHNPHLIKPKSAGIPTGTVNNGGYEELDEHVELVIDNSVKEIKELIKKYKYDTIYYSIGENDKFDTGLFNVDESVIDYIDEQIKKIDNCINWSYWNIIMSYANDYYLRDVEMKLDPTTQIKSALNKLGYLNINYESRVKKYINNALSKLVLSGDLSHEKPLEFYSELIKETYDYKKYNDHVLYSQQRFNELKNFLTDNANYNTLKDFYESCTEEELYYIGY